MQKTNCDPVSLSGIAPLTAHTFAIGDPDVNVHVVDAGGSPPIDVLAEPTTQPVWKMEASPKKITMKTDSQIRSVNVHIYKDGKRQSGVTIEFKIETPAGADQAFSVRDPNNNSAGGHDDWVGTTDAYGASDVNIVPFSGGGSGSIRVTVTEPGTETTHDLGTIPVEVKVAQ